MECPVKKMVRTVSLRPDLPEDRFLPMLEACAEIFNEHAACASENRTWNKYRIHDALYRGAREAHPEIPSAILQATRDCALEASKRCNKGRRGEWKTPVKRTLSVRYNLRTLSVRGGLLTLSCIGRRFRMLLDCGGNSRETPPDAMVLQPGKTFRPDGSERLSQVVRVPDHFRDIVMNWRCKAATLKHVRGRFRLNLVYEADAPPKAAGRALAVDVGGRNFAVTSDGDRHPSANPGVLRAVKRRYAHVRDTLQAKGTKSAKRRLRATAGREERFSRDVCHAVSKALAETPGVSTFVLEDLGGMRDRRRGRRANRVVHGLPFARLRFDLTYKAEARGKTVEVVEPAYTSQRCRRCGHTESGNRRKSRFRCIACGFCCHADDNASRNILFAYESGAVLRASTDQGKLSDPSGLKDCPRSPSSSRRKAPGGQAAVNRPTMHGSAPSGGTNVASHRPCAGGN